MAKTRKLSVNKEARKVKKDSKATTPTKIMNGKVRKKKVNTRVNFKSNENLNNSNPGEKCNHLRKLSVRLQRLHCDSNCDIENDTLNTKPKDNTKTQKRENNAKIAFKQSNAISYNKEENLRKNTLKTCLPDTLVDKSALSEKDKIHLPHSHSQIKTRKCSVNLTNVRLAQNHTMIPEKSTAFKTRKCVVRLHKTSGVNAVPQSKQCAIRIEDIGVAGSFSKTEDSASFNVPVLDHEKRKNFSKLSLSKSSNKFLDNDKSVKNAKESEKGSNTIAKKIEVLDAASTLGKENIRDQGTLKKSSIAQITKLSLKRKDTKNDAVSKNILQESNLEQELNSSVLFNPARNSTVLDFDKTKYKRQECSKEEIKLSSSSRDRSSSQNLANRSNEIENLLNSLDDEEEILLKTPEKPNETSCQIIESIQDKNEKLQKNTSKSNNTTYKFFHHKTDNAMMKTFKKPPQRGRKSNNLGYTKKRRSTKGKRDSIYEFLSQSDTVKHADPAADIVKKLIAEGKVRVATNCKGKGKPKFKNIRIPIKQMKKIRPIADKKLNQVKNQTKKVAFIENKEISAGEEENFGMDHFDNDHFDDNNDNYDQVPDLGHEMVTQRKKTAKDSESSNTHKFVNEQKGTFSNLARKVLMNQTGRSNLKNKTKAELLNAVRNIISTPKNKKILLPHTALESELSPIVKTTSRPLPQASPWRVNEDAYLPRTFNFSTSSANLPSYSSDIIIPSTPKKEHPKKGSKGSDNTDITADISITTPSDQFDDNHKNPTKIAQPDNVFTSRAAGTTSAEFQHKIPTLNEPSMISSFSSNDSNAENMPPPKPAPEVQNENENIFNLKQLPNPRRTLKYRSPLKAINILEVVQLPPYKHPNKNLNSNGPKQAEFGVEENLEKSLLDDPNITTLNEKQQSVSKKNTQEDLFGFEDFLSQADTSRNKNLNSNGPKQAEFGVEENLEKSPHVVSKKNRKEDLFGFEDFLSQTETSSQENLEFDEQRAGNEHNRTIHDKLQDLRKLKPAENELQNYFKQKHTNQIKNIPVFDDYDFRVAEKRQRGIKEMLCSTMLDTGPSTSKEAMKKLNNAISKNNKGQNLGKDLDISELFADLEPETTFNESEAHRTYTSIRPQKRKRRLKGNNFIMFWESDESEDESNSTDQRKQQNSRESDRSNNEATPKKKRHCKEAKENPELTKFVQEFNDLCKEVECHELLVEKSA